MANSPPPTLAVYLQQSEIKNPARRETLDRNGAFSLLADAHGSHPSLEGLVSQISAPASFSQTETLNIALLTSEVNGRSKDGREQLSL